MKKTNNLWIISGSFGGLLFAINLTLGSGLTYLTGNPGFSGLITGFTTSFVLYILHRIIYRKFGAITIAFTVYSVLAIPTVLLGSPGVYKIIIGLISGLAFDVILKIFRYKFYAFILGFIAFVLAMIPLTYYSYILLALPKLEKFKEAIFVFSYYFCI